MTVVMVASVKIGAEYRWGETVASMQRRLDLRLPAPSLLNV